MALPRTPIIKKFFSNKIESSRPDWGDYLLEIADIFSMFDGEPLDRDLLAERFLAISGRSPYALRDASNFRDEFGAYGTYLGLFHFEVVRGEWHTMLSKATRHFLCSTEPDVESFCRTQLSLFQYPNGAGAVQNSGGRASTQANSKSDTIREIRNEIRINPLRLICRVVYVMHKLNGIPLDKIFIPYETIFMLVNDDSINRRFSPSYLSIKKALESYEYSRKPSWTTGHDMTNFKRNFHIMERTGIFHRVQKMGQQVGLKLAAPDLEKAFSYAETIASMTQNFLEFEPCYVRNNIDLLVQKVITSPAWGKYFDSLSMPMDTLVALSDEISIDSTDLYVPPIGTVNIEDEPFPPLKSFQTYQIHAFSPSNNRVNPFETMIRREKANREHTRILNMLAATIRAHEFDAFENTFIDLYAEANGLSYIFEVKSNNDNNVLSQIRKAIAQLYEYRYRSQKHGAVLCIVS